MTTDSPLKHLIDKEIAAVTIGEEGNWLRVDTIDGEEFRFYCSSVVKVDNALYWERLVAQETGKSLI